MLVNELKRRKEQGELAEVNKRGLTDPTGLSAETLEIKAIEYLEEALSKDTVYDLKSLDDSGKAYYSPDGLKKVLAKAKSKGQKLTTDAYHEAGYAIKTLKEGKLIKPEAYMEMRDLLENHFLENIEYILSHL